METNHANPRKLYRVREGKMLLGVCRGIGQYFDLDVVVVRVAFLAFAGLTHGGFVLIYFIMALVMPFEGEPAAADEWREKWRYTPPAIKHEKHAEHPHEEPQRDYHYEHRARSYRGPSVIGELFQLLVLVLAIWALYTYVPQTQPFFDAIWRDVETAWQWVAAKLAQ